MYNVLCNVRRNSRIRLHRLDLAEINDTFDTARRENRFLWRPIGRHNRARVAGELRAEAREQGQSLTPADLELTVFAWTSKKLEQRARRTARGATERTLYRISPVVASHTVSARSAPPTATIVPVCPSAVTCREKLARRKSCSNPAGAP